MDTEENSNRKPTQRALTDTYARIEDLYSKYFEVDPLRPAPDIDSEDPRANTRRNNDGSPHPRSVDPFSKDDASADQRILMSIHREYDTPLIEYTNAKLAKEKYAFSDIGFEDIDPVDFQSGVFAQPLEPLRIAPKYKSPSTPTGEGGIKKLSTPMPPPFGKAKEPEQFPELPSRLSKLSTWMGEFAPLSQLRRAMRPKVRPGHRRIEWKCDCGTMLYADFSLADGGDIDSLEHSLQNPVSASTTNLSTATASSGVSGSRPPAVEPPPRDSSTPAAVDETGRPTTVEEVQQPTARPAFLALCVNTGGIYKTLAEISTEKIACDAEAFRVMKKEYLKKRGFRSRFKLLIKPITVEFIQFTLWNLRGGYISVCNRPNAIPSDDVDNYQYLPRPLKPLPPMPPEIFIHYLEHGEGDLSPARHDWLPRLPKRLDKRVIDCDETCLGWGVHIIEGPNRESIFILAMITMFASVLATVLWSKLQGDIQGGTGLGALIVAFPPAILAAFLFRLGAI